MCKFKKIAFNEHGYIVRCVDCGHYQLAFGTTMLTLSDTDLKSMFNRVQLRICNYEAGQRAGFTEETKSVVIPTPSASICLIVNKKELQQLHSIMDIADNEIKALSLLELFNP